MNRRLLICAVAVSISCGNSGGGSGPGTAGSGGQGQAGANPQGGAAGAGQAGNGQSGNGQSGNGQAGAPGQGGASGSAGAPGQGGAAGASGAAGAAQAGAPGGGAGGAPPNSPCGTLLPAQTSQSVLTRAKNNQRTAHFVQPSLTLASVGSAKFGPDATFNGAAKFTGSMEAVPLFVAGATVGTGMFIVASHGGGNSYITALDETSGATLWSRNLGASGNGVRSTPVIDAASGTIYTAFDATTGTLHHEVHAISIANKGAEVAGWPVNVTNIKSANNDTFGSFDVGKMIQRGALSLVNGVLYIPYGGVYGDGPPYKGFIVAINAANPGTTGAWSASGDRSGLWQAGGLASDGTSLFATTSNGSDATHKDSEEVVRITGMGTSTHAAKDVFFPSYWKTWDGTDNDFGSSSPALLQFSGTCQSLLVAPSKPGHLFLLDPANLGGGDGSTPLRDFVVANQANPGGEYKVFYAAPTAYISASGVHVAVEARTDAKCPNNQTGDQLMSIKLDMTTTPATPTVAWCAPVSGGEDRHSPISTSTDGVSNAIVWFVAGGALKAFNGDTGASLYSAATPCGNVQKQTTPIAANGRVVVGADGKLCSYSVQP